MQEADTAEGIAYQLLRSLTKEAEQKPKGGSLEYQSQSLCTDSAPPLVCPRHQRQGWSPRTAPPSSLTITFCQWVVPSLATLLQARHESSTGGCNFLRGQMREQLTKEFPRLERSLELAVPRRHPSAEWM